jgi:hypothetical protein
MAKKLCVLAICSSGGHWVQMRRISSAFDGAKVVYAAPLKPAPKGINGRFIKIPDANRWGKIRLIYMAVRVSLLVLWLRPTHVISTGAAPGYVAIRAGKLVGAKCLWLDSIANAEVLSLSGEKAGKHADVWLTQWPHLESAEGPKFRGSVL